MRIVVILLIVAIALVYASPDYFDILDNEFEQELNGEERTFYIAAEESIWDYSSQSKNPNVTDVSILGTRYYKALYHEYQDANFTKKKSRFHWQGNMGPILRAEVGDTIRIHFWNKCSYNFTMHPHGVFYEFEMEGAVFKDSYEEGIVQPNQTYIYHWHVLPRAGPGPKDGNSIVWGYHSHVEETDVYAGLYGAIVIYKPGKLSNDDIVTSLFVSDENYSPYLRRTLSELYPKVDVAKMEENEFYQINTFPSVNGLASSAPTDLVIKKPVDWHLLGWGTYWDVQNVKWEHGEITWSDAIVDQIRLMPASFYTVTMHPKTNGKYLFGALNNRTAGMVMQYTVKLS
ncbi:Cupredoxin [Helicostylum pulchrum]|uniref:Plastocyanin-like domain-containing protein n=1 Tax=Helicostylum pulchrum TaxID=562976 RepID=A0ABP9YDT8_9FUNG|nr:Cupredoxin [Helicostylum pulchrum]